MMRNPASLTKTIVLFIALVSLVLTLFVCPDYQEVGIYAHCPFANRLLYPFFHANIPHVILNLWCLIALAFLYPITPYALLLSYVATIFVPTFLLSSVPTVGLSGVIFFLFATLSFKVKQKIKWQIYMIVYLSVGFLLPMANGILHLYCYLLGFLVALLNKPYIKHIK